MGATEKLRCPACGAEYRLEEATQAAGLLALDKAAAAFGEDWILVAEYLACFRAAGGDARPTKALKVAKQLRLAREIWQMWNNGNFSIGGAWYRVGREEFREALRATCNQVASGLTNHNYLKKVLTAAASITSQREERELREREEGLRSTGCKPVPPQDNLPDDPAWRAEFQRLLKRSLATGLAPEEKARRGQEFKAHQDKGAGGNP